MEEKETQGGGGFSFLGSLLESREDTPLLKGNQSYAYNYGRQEDGSYNSKRLAIDADWELAGYNADAYKQLQESGQGFSNMSDNEINFLKRKYSESDVTKRKAYTNSYADQFLSSMGLPSSKELASYRQKYATYLGNGGMEQYSQLLEKRGDNYYMTDTAEWIKNQWAKDNAEGLLGETITSGGKDIKYEDTLLDEQLKANGFPPSAQLNEYYLKYKADQKAKQDKADRQKRVDAMYDEVMKLEDGGMDRQDAFDTVVQNPKYADLVEKGLVDYEELPSPTDNKYKNDDSSFDEDKTAVIKKNAKYDNMEDRISLQDYERHYAKRINEKKWAKYAEQQNKVESDFKSALVTPATTTEAKKQQYEAISKYLSNVRVTKDDGSLLTADDYSGYLGLLNAGVPADVIDKAQEQGFSAYEDWNNTANGKDLNKWAETKAMLDGLSKDDGVYNNAVSLYRETHAATGLPNYSKDSKYDPSLYDAQISPEMSTSRSTAVSASGAIYNAVNGKGYGNVVGASESQRELLKDFTDKTLSDSSLIDLMSDDEKGTFNLIFKESANRGLDYLQRLQPVLEQRRDNALFGKVMFASSKENAEDSAYKLNLSASIDEINNIKEGTSSYWKKEAWDRYSSYSDEALQRIVEENSDENVNYSTAEDYQESEDLLSVQRAAQFVLDTRKQARDDARVTSALYGYKEEDGKKATEEVEKLKAQDLPDELSRFINGKKVIRNDATDINTMASADAFSAYVATSESRLSTEEQLFINNMTEDQKNRYNWLLLHGKKGDAQKYFDYIKRGIDKKAAESVTAGFKEFGKENPFVASVGSVLTYPIGGMSAVLGSVDRLISGKEISDTDAALWDITGSLREGVQERISDSFENEGFANTLNFLYNVGMSSADSFLGAVVSKATVPFAGELMLSASAYASTLRAGLTRGLDREKAVQMAVASAAIEFVTEHMGIDNLVSGLENIAKKAAVKGSTSYMANVLAQVGINFIPEALEEGVGHIAETMADMMINGDASELMEYYDSLIAKGMSKEEANKLMSNKFAKETALEMLAGGLAGAESVGVGGTLNYGKVAAAHGVSAWASPETTRAWSGTHSKDFGKGKAIVDNVFGKEFSDSVQGYIDTKETVHDKRNINEISELLPQMRNTDELYDFVFDEKGNVKLSNEELVALSAALNSAGADADLDSIEQAYVDFMADNGQSARQRLANTNYKYIKTSQELHDARAKLNSLQNGIENAKRDYQGKLDEISTKLKDAESRRQAVDEKIRAIEEEIGNRFGIGTGKLADKLISLYAQQATLITEVNNHQNALNNITGEGKRKLDTLVSNSNTQIRDIQRSLDRHYASYSNLLATSTTKRSAYEAQYRFASMRVAEIGNQIDSLISSDTAYFANSEKYLENMDNLQTQLAEAQQEMDFWDRKRNKTAPSKLSDAIAAAHSGTVKEFLDSTEPAKATAPATANTANTAETANTPSNTAEQANQPSDAVKQENTAQGETAENATEEKKPKQKTEEKKEEPKETVEKKTYTISKTTQEKFNRIASKFGLKIVWQTRDEIGGNGRYSSKEPNKVYLATDMIADKGLLKETVVAREFFTHEVVHYVATTQWYQRLSNLAEAWYRYSGDKEYGGGSGDDYYEFLIDEQIKQEKELHHRDFTREQAREELTAYFVQDVLFEDKNGSESLDWLTKMDGNAVQNFLVTVEYLINRGKARRMKDGSAIKTLLLDAEHALGQAIRERKVLDAAGLSSSFSTEKKNTEQKNTAQTQQTEQNQQNVEQNAEENAEPAQPAEQAQPVAEESKTEQPAPKTEQFPNYWVAENDWNTAKKDIGSFDAYDTVMFVANNMGMEVGKELVNASDANAEDNGVYDKVDDIVSTLSESGVSPAAVATFLNTIYKDGGIDAIKNIPTGEGEANDAIVSAVKKIDSEHGSRQNAVEPTAEQPAEQPVQETATPVAEESAPINAVEDTSTEQNTAEETSTQQETVQPTAEESATPVAEEQAKAEPAKAYDDSDVNSNKKATDKQIVTEATRIFKGTTTDGYGTQLSQGAVKLHDGKQLITDSFQMYVFNNDVDGMPMIDESEQSMMPIYRFEEIMKKSRDEYEAGKMTRLPSVTKENLLSVSKKFGYSVPTSKNAAYPIYFGKGFPAINGKYMYQALSMFPDAQFFSLKDSPLSPIYMKSKNGDGVIVPLRTEKAKKDSKVRDYLWERYSNSKNIKEPPQLDFENVYYSAGTTISDLASRFNPNVSGRAATLSGDNIAVPSTTEAIDKSAVLVNENGDPVMNVVNNGNGAMFSIGTYEKGGRKAFEKYLNSRLKKKLIDNEQAEKLKSELERIYKFSKEYADSGEYVQFGNWSYMEVKKDPKGKPYLSVITPNNEYKMNLDFSLVCVKRRALDAVINEIVARGEMERIIFDEQAIARINEKIRSMNFETACQMCFVEAARYMQAEYADKFVDRYNKLVNSLGGEADYFNFGGNRTLETRAGIQHMSDSNLDFTEIDRVLDGYMQRKGITSLPKYRANKGLAYADTDEAIAYELKFNPESRRLLLRGDFMSSTGFDSLAMRSPSVLKLWNKKGQGAPKNQFSDMQYLNDIEKKSWDADKAYAVGGVRVQSFSDYVPTMFFDYVQMVADLAAGKLPAHAYTKELNFVKLFGLTGIKINMSLVPAIVDEVDKGVPAGLKYVRDENGNVVTDEKGEPLLTYAWAKESFGFDRKKNELDYDLIKRIQADEKYGKNCGSIAIGVSDEHILRMMEDPTIKMIIPYHSSGIPQIVAEMVKTNRFTDYQKDSLQHTRKRVDGKWVALSPKEEFQFNEVLHKNGDPKATVKEYLDWCEKNGYAPKFEKDEKSTKFKDKEGYYKVLEDFTLYDDNGNYIPQGAVQMKYAEDGDLFGNVESILGKSLKDPRMSMISDNVDELTDNVLSVLQKNDDNAMYSGGTTIADLSQGYTPRESINDVRKIFNQRDSRSSGVDDSEYMALAERYKNGDTSVESELQDAVDKAAKDAGYTIKAYHGTSEKFTEFSRAKQGANYNGYLEFGSGFYFTPDKDEAMSWANRGRTGKSSDQRVVMSVYLKPNKILGADSAVNGGERYLKSFGLSDWEASFIANRGYRFINYLIDDKNFSNAEVQDTLISLGYEAIDATYDGGDDGQYIVFYPEQIKSADPVTYRDNGEIIQLSERFNESEPDIRYSNGTTMQDLIASYGKKKQSGLGMLNDVQTAERTSKSTRISDVAQTVKEAPAQATQEWKDHVDDIVVEVLDENAVPVVKVGKDAGLVYRPMTMEEMNELGDEYITRSGGVDQAMRDLARDIPNATVSDLTRLEAAAMRVIAEVSKTNNFNREDSAEFLAALGILNSNWGRMGKAMQLLNASPLGRRKYMEKVIERINAENKKKFSKGAERLFHRNGVKEIVIPESKYRDLELATTPEEVRKAEFRISEEIGKQSPLSISDAIRNWRYFAMLANPVTHERNMLGNVGMLGMRMAKDAIAAGLENVAVKTGFMNAEDRTHYVNRAIPKEVSDFAVQLFADNAQQVQGQDRYGVRDKIHDAIKKSPIKLFDTLMRFNGDMLEKEDKIFLRLTYVSAAKQYMMSKGLTNVNDLTAKQKAEIHQYAKQQAQEATYRDASALADTLNALAKKGGAWQFAIESTIPFKKTPINITKRGIEYSPVGLAKGVIDLAKYAINRGKNADGQYRIPASKIADELGKGLVGSALALIGAFLAKAGILKLKAGDGDRDEAYEKDLGHQDYSLEIGNMSIKIESLVPMTFPLFVGAAAMDALSSEEKKAFIPAMSEAMLSIADPIMDMSFMSSLNNTLNSYNQNKLLGIAQNAVSSYASQFAPTVIGRLNSSLYPTRRTTKSSQKAKEGIGTENDYTLRSIASKTPGLNLALEPYVKTTGEYDVKDSFGDYVLAHINAFLSPVNVQMIDTNPVKNEIARLVETTGNVDFIPQNPQKYFKDGDATYNLTAKEYTEYSKDHNETVYAMLKDVINSEEYQNAETDDDKANLLKKAYNKSHEVARKKWKAIIIERHSNN